MSKRMLGAITVCLFLFTAPVYAEDEDASDEYVRNGVYFMAAAAFAVENFDLTGHRPTNFWNSFGAGGRLGYRICPFFAAEAQYEWIAGFDEYEHALGAAGKIKTGEVIAHTATVNLKVFPLGGRIQPYALVGVGGSRFETKKRIRLIDPDDPEGHISTESATQDGGFTSRFGAGVDLYGDETWAMFAETAYVLPTGGGRGLDYLSVQWGLLWRF